MKNCFGASRSPEGAPSRAASPIDCIFAGPRATGRLTAYLQGGRAQGTIIHCKNAVDLFRGRAVDRRSVHGTFPSSWGVQGCPRRPPKEVLKIPGGHQDGHQLESLHFYGVPWPHPGGQKSSQKGVVKLTTFFKKAVCKIEVDRRLESLHLEG